MILSEKAPALDDIGSITEAMEDAMTSNGVSMLIAMQFSMSLDEIYSNIVYYSGATLAVVECEFTDDDIILRFRDNGTAYDPTQKEDPDTSQPIEERAIGGLGIYLVKNFMDRIVYKYEEGRNILTLVKRRES